MKELKNGFERFLEFTPGYDKRSKDPKKNFGIHGVTMRFVLKGEKGAVQFLMFTGWDVPSVLEEQKARSNYGPFAMPMAADLGCHSKKPLYQGQEPMGAYNYEFDGETRKFGDSEIPVPSKKPTGSFTPCPYLDGKACYYDGSSLNAERPYKLLTEHGEEAVWKFLEGYYNDTFDDGKEK